MGNEIKRNLENIKVGDLVLIADSDLSENR